MNNVQNVALLGATGKAGRYILTHLLQQGFMVNALIRKPENYLFRHPNLQVIKGDATSPEAMLTLLKGCQALISALGQGKDEPLVSSIAIQNIIAAMHQRKLSRYIFLTGLNLDVPGDEKSMPTQAKSDWMRQHFPAVVADKEKAYQLVAESNLKWTMLRLPWIDQTTEKREITVSLKDCLGERISTTSLAGFVVHQLDDDAYIGCAPFVADV